KTGLKARNKIAQGNALRMNERNKPALKGRHRTRFRPFRADIARFSTAAGRCPALMIQGFQPKNRT
ncbi:MAG: hypothetical protein LBN23_03300, partial [Paludibacter sp.]|nr:hypothetical protein [Paludibacter sp.]